MFVNNGFGSYRDLMKEYSFSYVMADWLSFEDNRSLQYNIDQDGVENYPDENYAREIMQLFSIGLFKLNPDGTFIHNANGVPASTYVINDVVSMSRAWTGFRKRDGRGGASTARGGWTDFSLDPLYIDINRRDHFPKNDLSGGYIVS